MASSKDHFYICTGPSWFEILTKKQTPKEKWKLARHEIRYLRRYGEPEPKPTVSLDTWEGTRFIL